MSAEGMNALREALTWHHGLQDPAVTIECARDALIKLLAAERASKAEIAELRDRLATAESERDALLAQRRNPTAWCAIKFGKGGWTEGYDVSRYLDDAARWHAEGRTVLPLYQ